MCIHLGRTIAQSSCTTLFLSTISVCAKRRFSYHLGQIQISCLVNNYSLCLTNLLGNKLGSSLGKKESSRTAYTIKGMPIVKI